ncbi:MAG: hypothetical protein ABI742_11910 [Gemmatimonadota bacterium]
MSGRAGGFSTVECLVAITLFSIGALGAAGSTALGVRAYSRGTHVAAAARLAGEVIVDLRHRLRIGQLSCARLSPGSRNTPAGEVVSWALTPVSRGVEVRLALSYATPVGQHTDSAEVFLRCH